MARQRTRTLGGYMTGHHPPTSGTVRGKPYYRPHIVRGKERGPIKRGREIPIKELEAQGIRIERGNAISTKTRAASKKLFGKIGRAFNKGRAQRKHGARVGAR